MIPIHTSICPDCQTDQKLQKMQKEKMESSEIIERLKKKKVLMNKNFQQAFSIKKKMTFLDEFNTPKDLQSNISTRVFLPVQTLPETMKKLSTPHPSLSKPNILIELNTKQIPLPALHSYHYKTSTNSRIFEMINIGFPISSLAWAPRIHEKQSLNQEFLAVGVCSFDFSNEGDELCKLTRKSLNLDHLQLNSEVFKENSNFGHVLIYCMTLCEKIQLYYTIQTHFGGIFDIKWAPSHSNNKNEIGLLAILTSQSRIVLYSMPTLPLTNLHLNTVFEPEKKIVIHLQNITITAFDWLNNKKNDIIICGDNSGNFFLIKLIENENRFEIIKNYFQAHSEEITDLRFFPKNNEDNILFASSSNDGFLKIFDTDNNETPLYDMHISKKKVFNILWDKGGKFLVANREGSSPSSMLISFFPAQKVSKMKICFLDKYKLMQIDSKPNPYEIDSILQSKGSFYSNFIYFSDSEGSIFYSEAENLRKVSSRKKKSTKSCGALLLPLFISRFEPDEGIFHCSFEENEKNVENKTNNKNRTINKRLNFNHCFKALAVSPNDFRRSNDETLEDLICYGNLSGLLIVETRKKQ